MAPRLLEETSRSGEDDPRLSPLVRATRWKVSTSRALDGPQTQTREGALLLDRSGLQHR